MMVWVKDWFPVLQNPAGAKGGAVQEQGADYWHRGPAEAGCREPCWRDNQPGDRTGRVQG